MDILIIGGTGLISTAIVQQLLDRGDRVTLFNRGTTPARFQGTVEHLTGNRWEPGSLETAVAGRTWDAVIDMTAFAPANGTQLVETFWGRTEQVILCSTTCVYGGPDAPGRDGSAPSFRHVRRQQSRHRGDSPFP